MYRNWSFSYTSINIYVYKSIHSKDNMFVNHRVLCMLICFQMKSQLKQFVDNYKDMSVKMETVNEERDEVFIDWHVWDWRNSLFSSNNC